MLIFFSKNCCGHRGGTGGHYCGQSGGTGGHKGASNKTNRLMQFFFKFTNSYPQRLHSVLGKHSSSFGGSPTVTYNQTYIEQEVIFSNHLMGVATCSQ